MHKPFSAYTRCMEKMVQEDTSAEMAINYAIEEYGATDAALSYLETRKQTLTSAERARVSFYIANYRNIFRGMVVKNLGGNTAGLYDGSTTYLDESIPEAGESVEKAVAQGLEVLGHEKYHQDNKHTAPMRVVEGSRAGIAVVMGNKEFTQTAIVEALTVKETGDRFVHPSYVAFESSLDRAMAASGKTIDDVREAVNVKKDLTLIDDRKTDAPAPVLSA